MKPKKPSALSTPCPSDNGAAHADPDALLVAADMPANNVFAAMVRDSTGPATPPKKRMGRPPANGVRHVLVLLRAMSILKHFEVARRTLGHTASITATVKAVNAEFEPTPPPAWGIEVALLNSRSGTINAAMPNMKGVNKAEVERVLAEFQPKGELKVGRVRQFGNGSALWIGPRPATRSRRIKLR